MSRIFFGGKHIDSGYQSPPSYGAPPSYGPPPPSYAPPPQYGPGGHNLRSNKGLQSNIRHFCRGRFGRRGRGVAAARRKRHFLGPAVGAGKEHLKKCTLNLVGLTVIRILGGADCLHGLRRRVGRLSSDRKRLSGLSGVHGVP